MLSTLKAENRHFDEHAQPELKKMCTFKKKIARQRTGDGSQNDGFQLSGNNYNGKKFTSDCIKFYSI